MIILLFPSTLCLIAFLDSGKKSAKNIYLEKFAFFNSLKEKNGNFPL
jgi:hypothetical protein